MFRSPHLADDVNPSESERQVRHASGDLAVGANLWKANQTCSEQRTGEHGAGVQVLGFVSQPDVTRARINTTMR